MVNSISGGLGNTVGSWPRFAALAPVAGETSARDPKEAAAGRTGAVRPTSAQTLANWAASKLGLSRDDFASIIDKGRLSVGSDAGGTLRVTGTGGIVTPKGSVVPTTPDGVPDLVAMMEAGAEIIGAATAGGEPVVANQSQFGLKAYWAFQVDFHDGNGPQWVKGGTADPGPDASAGTRTKVFADLVDTVNRLPNSLIEYLSQLDHREGTLFDDQPPRDRIDLLA